MGNITFPVGAYPNGPDYSTFTQQFNAITALWGRQPAIQVLYVNQGQSLSSWVGEAGYYAGLLAGSVAKACIPCVGFPMFSTVSTDGTSDEQLQAFAAGTYDSIITGCMDAYTNAGYKTQIWRLGWEMNLQGTAWYCILSSNSAAYWIAAFQHIATTMRTHAAATGVTLQIVWNPGATSWSNAGRADQVLWPGKQYVDVIGIDLYQQLWPQGGSAIWDWISQTGMPQSQWIQIVQDREYNWMYPGSNEWDVTGTAAGNQSFGLFDAVQLAKANSLPIALPETGVMDVASGDASGVHDDYAFPIWLAQALVGCGVEIAFICVWDAGAGQWSINTTIPQTQAAWAENFSIAANITGMPPQSPPTASTPAPTPPVVPPPDPSNNPPPTGIPVSATVTGSMSGNEAGSVSGTFSGTFTPNAAVLPARDGFAGTNNGGNGATATLTLTTTQPNDVVVVFIEGNGGTPTCSDASNLTWTLRDTQASATSSGYWIAEFWAVAAQPLTGDVITVGTDGYGTYIAAMAIAVSGVDVSAPFAASAPTGSASGDVTLPSVPAGGFVIGAYRYASPWNPAVPGSTQTQNWTSENFPSYQAAYMMDVTGVIAAASTNVDVPGGASPTNGGIFDVLVGVPVTSGTLTGTVTGTLTPS